MEKFSSKNIFVGLMFKQSLWLLLSINNTYIRFKLAHFHHFTFNKHFLHRSELQKAPTDSAPALYFAKHTGGKGNPEPYPRDYTGPLHRTET